MYNMHVLIPSNTNLMATRTQYKILATTEYLYNYLPTPDLVGDCQRQLFFI